MFVDELARGKVVKILALDIGTVRIGIATSDVTETIASPYQVYRRKTLPVDLAYVLELVRNLNAGLVVIGLPLKLNGEEGQSVAMAKEFGDGLSKELGADKIVYQDERLSTVSAERILIESGMRREKRKENIDAVAATIILETYLSKVKNKKSR